MLFLAAHPHLKASKVNRSIIEAVQDLPGLTTHLLYDLYPYFHIDVRREQALLQEADLIVAQHPFYWYSVPPLLKLWMDDVLEYGWAYGDGGTALHGKDFLVSLSTGGAEDAYEVEGMNRFPMSTLLAPWNQTVHLCGMKWHKPLVFHRAMRAEQNDVQRHAESVRRRLLHFIEQGTL